MLAAGRRAPLLLAAATVAWLAAAAGAAAGTASAWNRTEQTALRLVAGTTAVGRGETVPLGLHFTLRPGWKVYWRSPGSGGLPPAIDWAASENVAGARIAWPAPRRFEAQGIESFGYADEVVLPIQLRLTRAGEAARAVAAVDYLTCREICIPYQATLTLDLPAGPADPSPEAALIARFLERVPGDGGQHGIRIDGAALARTAAGPRLVATVAAVPPLAAPDLLVESGLPLDFAAPRLSQAADGRAILTARVDGDDAVVARLVGSGVTLTLVDGPRSAEVPVTVVAAAGPAPASLALWIAMLATALLGGLVLNLMPCVLPVLSLKLLGVVEAGGRERAEVRRGFVASSAGILVSFAALAAGAIALQAGGHAAGWGIQFQHPWFLAALAGVLALFAANLWGWFAIPLPGFAQAAAAAPHRGTLGHFLTGAFAALMATPCSAPFLGTAVGFALSRGPLEILAIFLALGVGLALPYLAVAAFPGVATRLPRPGAWMNVVRRLLAVALVATCGWLLLVLAAQQGTGAALGLAGVLVAGVLLLGPLARLPAAWRTSIAAATLVAFAVVVVPRIAAVPPAPAPSQPAGQWRPFDRAAIAGLVGAGRLVFVDVTADWCITCQVNKKLVLGRGAVADRLAAPAVVAMRADWTRPDPAIAAFLADHGRYGIPFNVVYGPGAPQGVPLPELLTESAVLEALARAAGPARTAAAPGG
ncbi:MAG: thioredoxin family protein [Alphaproteobacteria bacterium]|nr:thioredoxin family protein [Alphaproteobacteria bacterium]